MANPILADGFVSLCVDTSKNIFGTGCKMLYEGAMLPSGSATPETLVSGITTYAQAVSLFGAGSVLAEGIRIALAQCPTAASIDAIGHLDSGGAAAVTDFYGFRQQADYLAGGREFPWGANGNLTLSIGDGAYSVTVPVLATDTTLNIVPKIVAAFGALKNLPFTVSVTPTNSYGFRVTALNQGVAINLSYSFMSIGSAIANPYFLIAPQTAPANPVPASQTNYANLIGSCCYSCYALLSNDPTRQANLNAYLATQWSCDTPMCFGHSYSYAQGTLGQVLSQWTNSATMSMVAVAANDPEFGWAYVAAYATLSCCAACNSPEISVQGQTQGVLNTLQVAAGCTPLWPYLAQQQLEASGFVTVLPLATSGSSTGTWTNPYVVNDITEYLYDSNNRPNATFRDTSSRRLMASTGIAVAQQLQNFNGLGLFTKNTEIKKGTFGTNPRLMLAALRAWARSQEGVLFSSFTNMDQQIILQTDAEVAPKCQGLPGKLHLFINYQPPNRISNIATTLQPQLLTNC